MPIHNKATFDTKPELLKGNVQIIASAGSGKTEFVSERIATQLDKGIAKPSEIAALTFNDAAAEELKFRVRDKIKLLLGKQPDFGEMYIGTIHAFAFMILQEFVPRYRAYDMLDENSRKAFTVSLQWKDGINLPALYNGLKRRGYKYNAFFARNNPGYWKNWTLETFLNDVDFFREESLTEEEIDNETFKIAIQKYQEKLDERRFLDFSGILRLAVDSLKTDPYALKEIRSRYKFFTVDEYQDINPIQEELISLVSGKQNVCVVGDDDQSIYQWRGADVENILTFEKRYDKVTKHFLQINRRSHDSIVNCAADFISQNSNRFKKAIQPNDAKTEEGDLYKICFEKQEEEIDWIVNKIQNLHGKAYLDKGQARKLMFSDMVLLFRRRNDAHAYKEALEEAGINVVYSGMGGLLETEEVSVLLQIFQYIGETVKEGESNFSLLDIFERAVNLFHINYEDFKALIAGSVDWVENQKRLSLQGLYYKLLSGLGLAGVSYHNGDTDDMILYNLGKFSMVISDFEGSRTYLSKNDIKRFIDYVQTFVSNAYDEGSTNSQEGLIDAVKIMTLHGTKGLGFPVVFMPHLKATKAHSEDRITFLDKEAIDFSRYGGSIEDERRLYYVAITRAKKFLFLSTCNFKLNGKRKTGLHPFWQEIQDGYFLTTSVEDPTERSVSDIERLDSDTLFPTNYSELSYYLSCSYDYRMRFIYGFNPELVQALGYGKQVHNLINLLHKEFDRTRKIPDGNLIKELVDNHFYMRYAATKQEQRLKQSCLQSLQNYVDLWRQDFSLAVKTEQNFEMDFGEKALINGSIDMLSRSPQDENVLEIIDFKTGKVQSQFEEKYAHQVVLYTIAATEALEKDIDKAYLHYLDSKKAERKEIDITPEKIKETKQKLNSAIDGITSNKFPRKPEKNSCAKCDWSTICPQSK